MRQPGSFRGLERQTLLPERGVSIVGDGAWWCRALDIVGHACEAQGVVWHHKTEFSTAPMVSTVERSLLQLSSVQRNAVPALRFSGPGATHKMRTFY